MRHVNIHSVELDTAQSREGYSWRAAELGPAIGSRAMGATLYQLPPGQASFPYHYEYGCEEWLLVVSGTPTLRDPDGEHRLAPGDLVCFPEGPQGAHRLVNDASEPSRVMLLSTKGRPAVAVFPDSAKLALLTGNPQDDLIARTTEPVGYWEGEE